MKVVLKNNALSLIPQNKEEKEWLEHMAQNVTFRRHGDLMFQGQLYREGPFIPNGKVILYYFPFK